MWGQGIGGTSLSLLLNFAVNLKLRQKIKSIERKKKTTWTLVTKTQIHLHFIRLKFFFFLPCANKLTIIQIRGKL